MTIAQTERRQVNVNPEGHAMEALGLLSDEELSAREAADDAGFGALDSACGPLPLKALDVRGQIAGLQYRLCLTQTFVNTHPEPLEATYIFPLPERAAVGRFVMRIGTREIEGVLKERGAARREYDQAIQTGHRAGIAEEERANVFTMRVGNILPGETATVELALDGPLSFRDGEAEFRFPFVVAPRYIPGAPLSGEQVGDGVGQDTDAVPDASRITPPVLLPGFPNPVRLCLELEIDPAGLPFGAYRSSLHALMSEKAEDGKLRVRLQPGERLNRDFILRFQAGDEAVRTALTLTPDQAGERGTFTLTLVPPQGLPAAARPRDIVFVVDVSWSMEGWKLAAARQAVTRMIETLTDADRFEVLSFASDMTSFVQQRTQLKRGQTAFWDEGSSKDKDASGGMVWATEGWRTRAVQWVEALGLRGGTEIAPPLIESVDRLSQLTAPDRDRILVVITDGQITNERQIMRAIGRRLANIRIFAVGIDTAVHDGFLKTLAHAGGGQCELVENSARLNEVFERIHRQIGTPVLTGVKLETGGLALESGTLTPSRLPDLFAGTPLVIQGRYHGAVEGSAEITAMTSEGKAWSRLIESQASPNPAATKLWARSLIRDLGDDLASAEGSAKDAFRRQILETSLAYGVLSQYTAFLAVDRKEIVNRGGQQHRATQAVEMPEGWEMDAGQAHSRSLKRTCYMLKPAGYQVVAPPEPRVFHKDSLADLACSDVIEELGFIDPQAVKAAKRLMSQAMHVGVGEETIQCDQTKESKVPSPAPAIIIPPAAGRRPGQSGILSAISAGPVGSGIAPAPGGSGIVPAARTAESTGEIVFDDIELLPTDDAMSTQQGTVAASALHDPLGAAATEEMTVVEALERDPKDFFQMDIPTPTPAQTPESGSGIAPAPTLSRVRPSSTQRVRGFSPDQKGPASWLWYLLLGLLGAMAVALAWLLWMWAM